MFHSMNTTKATLEALTKHEIVKDVFKGVNFQLKGNLIVDYPQPDATVAMGNMLAASKTQDKPKLHFQPNSDYELDTNGHYTVVMTDPDAPSRSDHKFSEYCHFVDTGIKFTSSQGGLIANGKIQQPYMGPAPPKGTGPHRYIWLFFKENDGKLSTHVKDRPNWGYGTPATGVAKFAKENNLELLAANFYFTEHK
ncbi:hypothetical protein KAFR_0D00540 [Kazachstania africana CBS 2517]|uniref:Carboxypeptidase Y inhibitor n=1 Tax=Kazachstania africana (strain ATCC 22294 / BCRC 22015 / CBS 2517 / CECT 1963 / NBRC 1671 / NRRL Y-8276) TaxID=1071382 RepID=H2ATK1_KAZAF|nr:hypothetical protein KAFR_0D00540 [Kazachstania africana CBS 2517]CCF57701.1 hypothetical protein KAFR_0D00540 [Kazachstania africana CBS 2517]